jgi:hypothetical protein
VPVPTSFDYAVVRVVPRVERAEFINAGVIIFCLQQRFLEARVQVQPDRLQALWPEIDLDLVRQHLEAIPKIAAGDPAAGPIALLSQRERFHWLVAPRSTIIQISPVHSGLCDHPHDLIGQLASRFVDVSPNSGS